jgi:predicted aspartyl protease
MDIWGLLDTGADYLMLNHHVAATLGINLQNASAIPVTVASGQSVPLHQASIEITILGKRVPVTALFGPGKDHCCPN